MFYALCVFHLDFQTFMFKQKFILSASNFDVYCTVHDQYIINTKFPTYMHNVVSFQRVSA